MTHDILGTFEAGAAPRNGALSTEDLPALLEELRAFRTNLAARGPILEPDENWQEFIREGLD